MSVDKNELKRLRRMLIRHVCSHAVEKECFDAYVPENDEDFGPVTIEKQNGKYMWVKEYRGKKIAEYPVFTDDDFDERYNGYLYLLEKRPEMFVNPDGCAYKIITDVKIMLEFEEKNDKSLGLVLDNFPYYYVVADLVEDEAGKRFRYVRVIHITKGSGGTVMIPLIEREGKDPLIGIINVFRHSIRDFSHGELPRGFLEVGLSEEENAAKELKEEFGIEKDAIKDCIFLGKTHPDTGILSTGVGIYLVKINGDQISANIGHEGIVDSKWLSESELDSLIEDGVIKDGFTQSALLFYKLYKMKNA